MECWWRVTGGNQSDRRLGQIRWNQSVSAHQWLEFQPIWNNATGSGLNTARFELYRYNARPREWDDIDQEIHVNIIGGAAMTFWTMPSTRWNTKLWILAELDYLLCSLVSKQKKRGKEEREKIITITIIRQNEMLIMEWNISLLRMARFYSH